MRFMSFRLDARRGVVAAPYGAGQAIAPASGSRVTLDDGQQAVLGPVADAMGLVPGDEVSVVLAFRRGRGALPVAVEHLSTGRSAILVRLAELDRAWAAARLAAAIVSLVCLPSLLVAGQGWALVPLLAIACVMLRFLRRVREYEAAIERLHAKIAARRPSVTEPGTAGVCVPAGLRWAA